MAGHPTRHGDTWRIRWVDANGIRRSEVYAERRDAVLRLAQHRLEATEIRRGLRAAPTIDRSFSELCDYWLTNRAARKRSRKDDETIIRRLRASFGELSVRAMGVEQADQYAVARTDLSSKTLANHLTLLVSMLRLAHELGWTARVPRIRKPRTPLFTRDYRYLRTQEEVSRFLRAAKAEGELVFALYTTAIYTGLRAGELAGLQPDDIDLGRRLITVQRSFAGPTKSGDVRYVPILDPLLPVLREWLLKCPGTVVFPNQAGSMHGESAYIFQEILHRVLDAAGFPRLGEGDHQRRYIRFHDLRHTFASHWMMNGGDLFKLQRILGHKSVTMTQRYAHLAPEAFAADHGRLGDQDALAEGVVVQFPASH
ncbi:MAG: tyrosine-type recombinase/integrase [Polyangia bacterium]